MDSVASQDREKAVTPADWLVRAWVLAARHKFSCFLSERPADLAPRKALAPASSADAELIVNTSFRYQPGSELPDEIQRLALPVQGCLRRYPIAWVTDPRAGIWIPFWTSDECADVLPSLRPGEPPPSGLGAGVRRALVMAEILVPPEHESTWRARREKIVRSARSQLQTVGYLILHDLIHPLQLGALRQHYRALLAGGDIPKGDWIEQRYGLHSEMMSTFLHLQLRTLVGHIAGEPVKPSFVYLGSYRECAALPRHVDRPQCEFSISLLVDYWPDPDGPCGWPLYLESQRAAAVLAADLAIGDGVLYRGREVSHHRDALPAGHEATLVFLNYVREDFAGRLW
jgi:hypothetical protein